MSYGRRHIDVLALAGWDVLFGAVLPASWWLRIMAVRFLRHLKVVPMHSTLSLLLAPTHMSFELRADGKFSWGPKTLAAGEVTFTFRGRVWEIRTVDGQVAPWVQTMDPHFISARQ